MSSAFSDAVLVLIGHGSTLNADSKSPVCLHAAELRRRKLFRSVHEAFCKQEPFIAKIVHDIDAPRVFCVPLFVAEGYFTTEVIPRELGFQPANPAFPRRYQRDQQTIFYCGPVGTHPSMTDVILRRAKEVVEESPAAANPADTTLFVAGHGTGRNENSRKAVERHVAAIRGQGTYAAVHAVFIEEQPRVAEVYEVAQTKDIIVVPFLISDGMHSLRDIPVLLGESEKTVTERLDAGQPTWRNPTEKLAKRVWYTASVGTEPLLADVILERVREAITSTKL